MCMFLRVYVPSVRMCPSCACPLMRRSSVFREFVSSMRCFLPVHVPYVAACVCHSMYVSLREYVSSWVCLFMCMLSLCISFRECPSVPMFSSCVSPSMSPTCACSFVCMSPHVSLRVYVAPCMSLHVYVLPCVCPFRAHVSFVCMYPHVYVAPCVCPSACIMLRV